VVSVQNSVGRGKHQGQVSDRKVSAKRPGLQARNGSQERSIPRLQRSGSPLQPCQRFTLEPVDKALRSRSRFASCLAPLMLPSPRLACSLLLC
jgi:hypothetical protein